MTHGVEFNCLLEVIGGDGSETWKENGFVQSMARVSPVVLNSTGREPPGTKAEEWPTA